jgi:hypothetical protein
VAGVRLGCMGGTSRFRAMQRRFSKADQCAAITPQATRAPELPVGWVL